MNVLEIGTKDQEGPRGELLGDNFDIQMRDDGKIPARNSAAAGEMIAEGKGAEPFAPESCVIIENFSVFKEKIWGNPADQIRGDEFFCGVK